MKEYIKREFMNGNVLKLSKFARKKYLEKNYPEVVNEIESKTLNNLWITKFSEKIYCYLYDVYEKPVCKECGCDVKFKQFSDGYASYCGEHSRSFKKGKKWEEFGLTPVETKKRMSESGKGRTWEERYGIEKAKEMKQSMSSKFKNRELTDEWREKISKSNKGKLKGNKNPMRNPVNVEKLKSTFIEKGIKIPDEHLTEFELYKRRVKEYTENEFRKHFYDLKNSDKRGKGFELDHKFSIFEGFKQNVPVYLIGSIHNLEMIPMVENRSKFINCSTTIDKILKGINNECNR